MSFDLLPSLPVQEKLPEIVAAFRQNGVLFLSAEPGAGKSTLVPPAFLLDEPDWLAGKKIIMLEPRRIAARATAGRMAQLLGCPVGGKVGYRTGTETKVSGETRIEVVTEAILTRMIQHDPDLPEAGLIIFDEFHERNIHADLGLALALDVRANLREDLRIMVMSATLDLPSLKKLIPDAETIHVQGRVFPVRTIYSPVETAQAEQVAFTIRNAMNHFPGDALVFLPGEAEILQVQSALGEQNDFDVLPLYGNLPAEKQDRIFTRNDRRRVILSTAIAETSLTVEGVQIVIDCGWMRVPRFSPANGMNRLETIRVSLAAAEQRRGRAGRVTEGVCIRLWSETGERGFEAHRPPEIMESDLCELTLELLNWGVSPEQAESLPFPDPPPAVHLEQAYAVLNDLGAVQNGKLTDHGRALLKLPIHPRLGHMILKSHRSRTALQIAALLGERDFLKCGTADISARLEALGRNSGGDPAIRFRIRQTVERLTRNGNTGPEQVENAGEYLAYAYPDRVAKKRDGQSGAGAVSYILANGTVAELDREDVLTKYDFLAVGETTTLRGKTKIRLAAPVAEESLKTILPVQERFDVAWDSTAKCVRAWKIQFYGSMVLDRKQVADVPDDELLAVFLEGIRKTGFTALGMSKNEQAFRERVTFLHRNGYAEQYPDFSEEGLMASLEDWLAPYVSGFRKLDELKKLNYRMILESALNVSDLLAMRQLAPEKFEVPSGSHITINYSDPLQPIVSVRLQELFGLKKTPSLAGGRVPLLMDILSPAMRTVQKTRDLESFWNESYFLVRKDMRGRYPKHDWPEDPTAAIAHRGVKRPK
ncbi:MAG: ATP-dependent helicase HrpB [Lentisphaerae bacterium]|nr:ATP-dependent helicase HrpB [Lentisphaerota bacterium]